MFKRKFRSFTLLEVLFVAIIVSIWLMSILYAINYALENVKAMKQRVIAINLAREGMEWIYQIRDTNRLLWPAQKDKCRLDMNPMIDELSPWCSDDAWMWSGNYILQKSISGNQEYFYMSWWSTRDKLDLSDWVQASDNKFALCLSGDLLIACPNYAIPVTYFRQIYGEWLFKKDSDTIGWDYLNCQKWDDPACWWNEAKEYRFCSRVSYVGQWVWEVELCWIITNFAK